jgi:hypothetical protein
MLSKGRIEKKTQIIDRKSVSPTARAFKREVDCSDARVTRESTSTESFTASEHLDKWPVGSYSRESISVSTRSVGGYAYSKIVAPP